MAQRARMRQEGGSRAAVAGESPNVGEPQLQKSHFQAFIFPNS